MSKEYYLSQDQSSHWYVVPLEKQKEWNEWCELDEDDEKAWDAPEWATSVGGCTSLVKFKEFRIS